MLKKIRSLVSSCDKKIFAWLEGESSSRCSPSRQTLDNSATGSNQSVRSFYSPGNKMEIPDPWD